MKNDLLLVALLINGILGFSEAKGKKLYAYMNFLVVLIIIAVFFNVDITKILSLIK